MDKNSANGGPPSYTTASAAAPASASASTSTSAPTQPAAAPPAAAAAPLIISDVAGLSINDNELAEPARRTEDVPPGVTLKEANDPASTYSQTRVALELPLVTATKRIPSPLAQSAPLAPFLLHCTLFASYDLNSPHPVPLRQVGCPAQHSRGEASATSKTKVSQSVSKLRKRLGVQIPVSYLGSPGFNPSSATPSSSYDGVHAFLSHPHPRNGAEMVARSGNVSRYRRVSLFQAQAREMTGIVSRPLVERVLSVMYAGQGIYDPMAAFPAEAVLRYSNKSLVADSNSPAGDDGEQKSGWLAKLKAKAKAGSSSSSSNDKVSGMSGSHQLEHVKSAESVRDARAANDGQTPDVRTVKASMVFATIDLLAPPPRLLETGGPYPIEMNKASDADLATSARLISEFDRGSDEERFQKFYFSPSAADDQLCAGMLRALERRGAIWVEAGRLITPSSRNPNPRERARFLVKGLFPERFVYRCKYYRARKFEPMPNDLAAKEVKRFGSPLIVHLVQERTGNEGIDLRDYFASRGPGHGDDWEWDEDDNLMLNSAAVEGEGGAAPPDYVSTQREMLGGYGIETQRAKALIEAEQDFFEGWSIGVTEEPFRNGGFFENVGTGVGLWALAAF